MKFQFYIVDLNEGNVVGTNSEAIAQDLAVSEEYFVIDSEKGEWIQPDDIRESIEEIEE